jgi:hypothetical protein
VPTRAPRLLHRVLDSLDQIPRSFNKMSVEIGGPRGPGAPPLAARRQQPRAPLPAQRARVHGLGDREAVAADL